MPSIAERQTTARIESSWTVWYSINLVSQLRPRAGCSFFYLITLRDPPYCTIPLNIFRIVGLQRQLHPARCSCTDLLVNHDCFLGIITFSCPLYNIRSSLRQFEIGFKLRKPNVVEYWNLDWAAGQDLSQTITVFEIDLNATGRPKSCQNHAWE